MSKRSSTRRSTLKSPKTSKTPRTPRTPKSKALTAAQPCQVFFKDEHFTKNEWISNYVKLNYPFLMIYSQKHDSLLGEPKLILNINSNLEISGKVMSFYITYTTILTTP